MVQRSKLILLDTYAIQNWIGNGVVFATRESDGCKICDAIRLLTIMRATSVGICMMEIISTVSVQSLTTG